MYMQRVRYNMKSTIKFFGTIRKVGNSGVVTIPRDYIDNDLLKIGEEYTFVVSEEKHA